jgi:hypothetical protein
MAVEKSEARALRESHRCGITRSVDTSSGQVDWSAPAQIAPKHLFPIGADEVPFRWAADGLHVLADWDRAIVEDLFAQGLQVQPMQPCRPRPVDGVDGAAGHGQRAGTRGMKRPHAAFSLRNNGAHRRPQRCRKAIAVAASRAARRSPVARHTR